MKKQSLLITVFCALFAFTGLSAVSMNDENVNDKISKWKRWKEDREKFLEHHNITVPQSLLEAEEKQKMNEINGTHKPTHKPVRTQEIEEEIEEEIDIKE